MTLKQALHDKYKSDIPLSTLHGKQIELDTTTCGIVTGTYQYGGFITVENSDEFIESDLIILKDISSELLLKDYPIASKLKDVVITFKPEQVKDITLNL